MRKNKLYGLLFIGGAVLIVLNITGVLPNIPLAHYTFGGLLGILGICRLLNRSFISGFTFTAISYYIFSLVLQIPYIKIYWLVSLVFLLSIGFKLLFPKANKYDEFSSHININNGNS
ncbi:MAG: hypothetical protein WBO70_06525, partial [Erysipelotrichaceae bacterium]